MAYAAKMVNVLGFVAKEEAVFGVAETLSTSADAIQPYFTDRNGIPATLNYQYDGKVGPAPGSLGNIRRAIPTGATVSVDIPFFFKGGGAAYSASVFPLLHRLWKASGFTATLDATGGAETYAYAPTAAGTAPTSLTVNLYTDGELIPLTGCLLNWKATGDSTGLARHTFTIQGVKGTITDSAASVPAGFTYQLSSVVPASPAASTLLIGLYLSAIGTKSFDFDLGRGVEARPGMEAADGHLGFVHRGRNPKLRCVVEATAFVSTPFNSSVGLDPYELYEAGTSFAASFQSPGAQYNKWKLLFAQAQISAPPTRERVNGVACWGLEIEPYVTTATANDDLTVVTA